LSGLALARGFATSLRVRILLINYAAAAPRYGSNFRNSQLARLWVEMGHSVTIVGCSYTHLMPAEIKFRGLYLDTEEDGVRYVLLKAPKYQGSGLRRAINMFACMGVMRLCEGKIVGNAGVDVVMAASVYQVDNYPARRIARRQKAIFVRETRDVWPLTLIELSGMSPRHPYVALIQHAENFGYRHADMVATTLPNSFGHMQEHGLDRERWIYMPQCPNPFQKEIEKPMPAEHAAAFTEARERGNFVVIFTGSLVLNADLETLLGAAKSLENEKVEFLVIGRGPLEASLKERAAGLGLKNLRFLPPVERAHVPAMLRAADAATVGFLDRPLYEHGVSPNKMFEYMENSLPIIFHCRTKGDPVAESGAGFVVEPQKPEAIAEAVRKLMKMGEEERKALGAKGHAFVRERHDLRKVAAQYVRVFEELRAVRRGKS
jgi:glycosyltransferase involved in cell wall biosynthesis